MSEGRLSSIARIEASLIDALAIADQLQEFLLAAKIDEALTCVRSIEAAAT